METRNSRLTIILSVIDMAVVIALFVALGLIYFNAQEEGEVYDVSDQWEVALDETVFHRVDLSDFKFPDGTGDVSAITMSRTLTRQMGKSTTMRIYTKLSDIEVDVDGRTIYSSMEHKQNPKVFTGMGYHFVQIPMSRRDQDVTIRIFATEKDALSGLPDVALTSTHVAYSYFVDRNAIGIFISIFIFMFGLVVTIISLLYTGLNQDYFRLFLIGSFSLTVGFWSMCSQKILLLFGVPISLNSTFEYFLLGMTFLPLLGYDIKIRKEITEDEKMILRILISITLAYNVVAGILHFTDILHYSQSVVVFHVIALADCVAMIFVGVRPVEEMEKEERAFHVGLIGMSFYGFWRIVSFMFANYMAKGSVKMAEFSFPLVCMLFIAAMLVSYMFHLYDMVLSQAQEEALTKLAYNDALTGLYNRAKSEEIFSELDEHRNVKYAFINYDLNGLKTLNDKYGHTKGDELIASFGHLLGDVFAGVGMSIRMGGDEFITVLRGDETDRAEELVENLKCREKEESEKIGITIDSSYGIAYSKEVYDPEAEQVFRMADERMYEMKRKSKEQGVTVR